MEGAINWFEIPANDLDRAINFYETVLGVSLHKSEPMPGFAMAQFPTNQGTIGGAVLAGEGYTPSADGTVVYINVDGDLDGPLGRVEGAGGKVLVGRTDIGENGFMAYVIDTEGNKVGLHSMS